MLSRPERDLKTGEATGPLPSPHAISLDYFACGVVASGSGVPVVPGFVPVRL